MKRLLAGLIGSVVALISLAFAAALIMVHTKAPEAGPAQDVFKMASLARIPRPKLPDLQRFEARDGTRLPYRLYPSELGPVLIFVHGSSYHGGGYHLMAQALTAEKAATVVLPNMRGHYRSGERSGDVDYFDQMEDDVSDLIDALTAEGVSGPFLLGGHSSGGGFAIRFAGGAYADKIERYLLMAPAIPGTPTLRDDAGWANVHMNRLMGLLFLNALGIHRFDHLETISFNKPEALRDRTETLAYSHRLNVAYHPRLPPEGDLAQLPDTSLLLVGENDEAINAEALVELFETAAPSVRAEIVPHINHIMIAYDNGVFVRILRWIRGEG